MSLGWAYLLGSSTEVLANDSSPIHQGIIFHYSERACSTHGGGNEMDELATTSAHPFDDVASGLASGTITRRRALKLVGAALLGVAGLGAATREAEAAPTCPADTRPGCVVACTNTTKQCSCIRTIEGNRVCVHKCCSLRTCNSSSQCRSGEVCMKTGCCREGEGQRCVTLCTELIPRYCG